MDRAFRSRAHTGAKKRVAVGPAFRFSDCMCCPEIKASIHVDIKVVERVNLATTQALFSLLARCGYVSPARSETHRFRVSASAFG